MVALTYTCDGLSVHAIATPTGWSVTVSRDEHERTVAATNEEFGAAMGLSLSGNECEVDHHAQHAANALMSRLANGSLNQPLNFLP